MPRINDQIQIRLALPNDEGGVRTCVDAAYRLYVKRMGKKPAPMLDDYAKLITRGVVRVATHDGVIAGIVVLWPESDHLYVDNIAVHPDAQGRGVGAALLAVADEVARANNRTEIRLYTNEAMTENLVYYPRKGFTETHRGVEAGYNRVYYSRWLSD